MAAYRRVNDLSGLTCGLTTCTPGSAPGPGPTLGNEYWKPLPLINTASRGMSAADYRSCFISPEASFYVCFYRIFIGLLLQLVHRQLVSLRLLSDATEHSVRWRWWIVRPRVSCDHQQCQLKVSRPGPVMEMHGISVLQIPRCFQLLNYSLCSGGDHSCSERSLAQ